MKIFSALLSFATSSVFAAVLEQRAACIQDNCYRAVIKTSSLSLRSADCSSFLAPTTVTVSTVPAVTVTTTTYSIYGQALAMRGNIHERGVATSSVPTYASACSGSVRYSSACSCLGITQTTTTATLTPPATVTVTSTIAACNPANNYGLNYNGVSYAPPPGAQGNSSFGPNNFFTATAAECCAACFTTLGCGEFDFNNNYCTLFVWDGVTITNPYNPVCPWGRGGYGGGAGFSIAPGPCANVCPPNTPGGIFGCVTPN